MLIHCPHCELEAEVDVSDPANFEVKNEAALYARCPHIKEISASGKAAASRAAGGVPNSEPRSSICLAAKPVASQAKSLV